MKILFLISKVFEQKFELRFLCQIEFLTIKLNFSTVHTDAKSQYLSKNSILMKSTPTFCLNFPAKNVNIENLIFEQKFGFCSDLLSFFKNYIFVV